jgi:hypothetical protein
MLNELDNNTKQLLLVLIGGLSVYLFIRLSETPEGFKSNKKTSPKEKESFHEITNIHSDLENFDTLNKLCSAVELQDKIRQEKMKLEKTKQYYLKSQQQQSEIDKLKGEIKRLQQVRDNRIESNDKLKLAKYEQLSEVEEKMRQKMLDRIKRQKIITAEFNIEPYKAKDLKINKVDPTV